MTLEFSIISFGIVVGIFWLYSKNPITALSSDQEKPKNNEELEDPFHVEVIYQEEVVADLTDRKFVEMFWREYRITPRSESSLKLIKNDDLWEQCLFKFRDPETNRICETGFAGGTKPFMCEGKIQIRGLYFER